MSDNDNPAPSALPEGSFESDLLGGESQTGIQDDAPPLGEPKPNITSVEQALTVEDERSTEKELEREVRSMFGIDETYEAIRDEPVESNIVLLNAKQNRPQIKTATVSEDNKKERVQALEQSIIESSNTMIEYNLAELALAIRNGSTPPFLQIGNISEHKFNFELDKLDRLKQALLGKKSGLSDEGILRAFIADGSGLSSKDGKLKSAILGLEVFPREDGLGFGGVSFTTPGDGDIALDEVNKKRMQDAEDAVVDAQSNLRAACQQMNKTLSNKSGFRRLVGRLSESHNVQVAYENYQHEIESYIENRRLSISNGFNLLDFDKRASAKGIFVDAFMKRESKNWFDLAKGFSKLDAVILKGNRYFNGESTETFDHNQTLKIPSKPDEAVGAPENQADIRPKATDDKPSKPETNDTQTKKEQKEETETVAVEVLGVTFKVKKSSALAKFDSTCWPDLHDKKLCHPEFPFIWESVIERMAKEGHPRAMELMDNPQGDGVAGFLIDKRLGWVRDPVTLIEEFIKTGLIQIDLKNLQYSGRVRSYFSDPDFPININKDVISSSLPYERLAFPALSYKDPIPPYEPIYQFREDSPLHEKNLPKINVPPGKKLIHPHIVLAWRTGQLVGERRLTEKLEKKKREKRFFQLKPEPLSRRELTYCGVSDAHGDPIGFPDCFFIDEDAPQSNFCAYNLVEEYMERAGNLGNKEASKTFLASINDRERGQRQRPIMAKYLAPYGLIKDNSNRLYENPEINKAKFEIFSAASNTEKMKDSFDGKRTKDSKGLSM